MDHPSALSTGPTEIDFPYRHQPTVAMLTVIPVVVAMFITMALLVDELPPIFLAGLLVAALVCCLLVSWFALKTMCASMRHQEPESHAMKRMIFQGTDNWPDIVARTGSEHRVGPGLFPHGSAREREQESSGEAIMCARDKTDVQNMIRIAARVETARRKLTV
jgi:Ca2+/Na+ antiporter